MLDLPQYIRTRADYLNGFGLLYRYSKGTVVTGGSMFNCECKADLRRVTNERPPTVQGVFGWQPYVLPAKVTNVNNGLEHLWAALTRLCRVPTPTLPMVSFDGNACDPRIFIKILQQHREIFENNPGPVYKYEYMVNNQLHVYTFDFTEPHAYTLLQDDGRFIQIGRLQPNAIHDAAVKKLHDFCLENFDKLLPRNGQIDYYTVEYWLDHSNYSDARKQQFYQMLDAADFTLVLIHKSFLKQQELPFHGKAPRGIQSCAEQNLILLRPYYLFFEEIVFHSKYAIKHVPIYQRRDYVYSRLGGHRYYFSTDYSRFESSFKYDIMLAVELAYYKPYVAEDIYRAMCYCHQHFRSRNIFVSMDHDRGIRASGDGDTSLSNTTSNIMLTAFVFHTLGISWDGLFEGDDGLICFDDCDPQLVSEQFHRLTKVLGFELKLEFHKDLLHADFLSTYYGSSASWQKPDAVLTKLNASLKATKQPELAQQLYNSKMMSCWYLNQHAPILGPLCWKSFTLDHKMMFDIGGNSVYHMHLLEEIQENAEKAKRYGDGYTVDLATRVEYEATTGIDIPTQLYCEESWENLAVIFNFQELDEILDETHTYAPDVLTVECDLCTPADYLNAIDKWHLRLRGSPSSVRPRCDNVTKAKTKRQKQQH